MSSFGDTGGSGSAGHRERSTEDPIRAELNILSTEFQQHLFKSDKPLLDSVGVIPSAELVNLPSKTEAVDAGFRLATQSRLMRSGKRVVFINLHDGTGCSGSTFFGEAEEGSGSLLLGTKLMLIRAEPMNRRVNLRGTASL